MSLLIYPISALYTSDFNSKIDEPNDSGPKGLKWFIVLTSICSECCTYVLLFFIPKTEYKIYKECLNLLAADVFVDALNFPNISI